MAKSGMTTDEIRKHLSEILDDLPSESYNDESTVNEEYAKGLMTAHTQFAKRNEKLTELPNNYVDRNKKRSHGNDVMKYVSFGIFMLIIVLLTIAVFVAIVKANLDTTTMPAMVSLVSIVATYLGSIITILQIIFKYLFPTDEEKDTISMIQTIIQNDLRVEEMAASRLKNTSSQDNK